MPSLRFIQFTDMHLYGDPDGRLRDVATLPAFEAVVEHAARRFPARDGILVTGDLVQDDPDGYQHVRAVLGGSAVPVLCLPGNHDLPGPMAAALKDAPFVIGGSHPAGDWRIVLLDSWIANAAAGRLGTSQLAELDTQLAEHKGQHVLVCLHHQPIEMQSRWLDAV
ncbi:MAG TPA: metallophosphoesterase, partial [Steroidobacteraceae bacterium]|nr:metallophosphoesterase [Steroidobacteraceae bacterium]